MHERQADVVVVGAGPIGAYAAWQFAARGLDVVCLEAKAGNQEPSHIGAFHFERVAFDRTGVPLPAKKDVICTYPGVTVHAPGEGRALWVDGIETWALHLSPFIRDLRNWARKAGARIDYGRRVVRPLLENGRVVGVVAQTAKGEQTYRAVVTVDATGLARSVRRHRPALQFAGGEAAFAVYMEYWSDVAQPPQSGVHSYAGPNAWTASYETYWIVGMGRPVPLEQLKAEHRQWFGERFPSGGKIDRAVSGAIPYAFPPPTLVEDGLLVLGDAAATNKPFNGEGIASGMIPVKIAAEILPDAVKAGGTRAALWEINRRYFTGQGAKFAFLLAVGKSLLTLSEDELATAFDIGLVEAEDLRQTFHDYHITRPVAEWLLPLARLLRHPNMARKYGGAFFKAAQVARHFENFPEPDGHAAWARRFREMAATLA